MRKVLFIFSVLSDSDVEWLATAGERTHLDPGNVLIPVGARVDNLYFVLDGRLAVKTKSGDPFAFLEIVDLHNKRVAFVQPFFLLRRQTFRFIRDVFNFGGEGAP